MKKTLRLFFLILFVNGVLLGQLQQWVVLTQHLQKSEKKEAQFRKMELDPAFVEKMKQKSPRNWLIFLTKQMILSDYNKIKDQKGIPFYFYQQKMIRDKRFQEVYQTYQRILTDFCYFPVALDQSGRAKISYEDSWATLRTYGGRRHHEGTDLMASNNRRNYFPVVSVSDGIVEKKGWLAQGGYRLGIRSRNGIYFYYAHLASYEKTVQVGKRVYAGQIIGKMGDTGYSKKEGTTGNFPVHLHFGIYLHGETDSVNPYWLLQGKQLKRVYFKGK